jgi:hypothetical protein
VDTAWFALIVLPDAMLTGRAAVERRGPVLGRLAVGRVIDGDQIGGA